MPEQEELVLGSGSPRRRELLSTLGLEFRVRVADTDESALPREMPESLAMRLARDKLRAVSEFEPDAFVLAADTIVVLDEGVLGKPENDDEGRAMIRYLADRRHRVMTAVALGRGAETFDTICVVTQVMFRAIHEDEIVRYVAGGEGRDKAGGYAIQGLGGGFVRSIEGSYSNVVGLPVCETLELLRAHGAVSQWP